MQINRLSNLSLLTFILGLATIGCVQAENPSISASGTDTTAPDTVELTISVAASVQDAMQDIQTAYQTAVPNVAITYNVGPSGSLAQQISQGAPADIFLSASDQWMDDLEAQNMILPGSRQDLLLNTLVLIVRADQSGVSSFEDLGSDRVSKLAMGEPDSVPAGGYAKETLISLNLFDALQPKLVFGKDVRQVLSYVATGNVDAGLVYATDARLFDQVEVVSTASADMHSPILYPIGVIATSNHQEAAQAFVDFLSSDPAVAIFEDYGFIMAD